MANNRCAIFCSLPLDHPGEHQRDIEGAMQILHKNPDLQVEELLQTIIGLDDKNPGSLERAKALAREALKGLTT